MTQLYSDRAMDAALHAAMLGSGLADVGFYTAPGDNVDKRVRIWIDRSVQVLGEFGQVVDRRDEMAILLEDVTPEAKAEVLVEDAGTGTGERFQLGKNVSDDGSVSRWVVRNV